MQVTLSDTVNQFRHALDQLDWGAMPMGFHNFPSGTCGDISDILANYLRSRGIEEIEYVSGTFPDGESHVWLEVCGYIVDITADQFPDVSQSVIVTSASPWHEKLTVKERRKAGFIVKADTPVTANLNRVYNAVLDALQRSSLPVGSN